MSYCSAAEIEEKRKIAQEKLRHKREQGGAAALVNKPSNPLQNVQNAYNQSDRKTDTKSPPHENKMKLFTFKDNRSSSHPYQKEQFKNNAKEFIKNVAVPSVRNPISCTCQLISESRFSVDSSEFFMPLIEVFKSISSKSYDDNKKQWSFHIKDYELVQTHVGSLKPHVVIGTIPKNIIKLFSESKTELNFSCLASIEPTLVEQLLPFQKEGVCFGISKHGRVLIADEMGLGKTYQALAIADFYKDDWPLLICTTASTRDLWASNVRRLLPYIPCHLISCLTAQQDYIGDCKVLIASYNMMEKTVDKLLERRFGVLIMDESHTLKNSKAKCTTMAGRLARQANRVILLSGTPALSRPVELFTQLQMIDKTFFNFREYTTRYCAGKQTVYRWDATGQSNLEELNLVLSRKFMIRRLKADVLPQLAEKFRETVILDPASISTCTETTESLSNYINSFLKSKGREKEEILLHFYAKTAVVKSKAVCEYIKSLVKDKIKFIVFAHHQVMMDAISTCLGNLKVDFIRIDGSTRSDLRNKYVEKFQQESSCQVALLSLRACNAGITLTAAEMVIFAELDWNPSTLTQAESRVHRIGQNSSIVCRYLLANKTADDIIWQMLKNKQDVLNKAGLFSENLQDATHTRGPVSACNIEKYFKVEKSPNKALQTNNKEENESYVQLLNEDDDDLANLVF